MFCPEIFYLFHVEDFALDWCLMLFLQSFVVVVVVSLINRLKLFGSP